MVFVFPHEIGDKTWSQQLRNDSGCRLRHYAKYPTKALVISRRTCMFSNWVVMLYIYIYHTYIYIIHIYISYIYIYIFHHTYIYIYTSYIRCIYMCDHVRVSQNCTPPKSLDMIHFRWKPLFFLVHLILSRISILRQLSNWKSGLSM